MELREFAGRVLFARTLEDKLRSPDTLTDAHPGPAIEVPDAPGRPEGLTFKRSGAPGTPSPPAHRLTDDRDRGRLLHFFANHELLATELMALVLLRFPDAPPAFRRGVLQTLRDEQEHTRMYLRRMEALGVAFGELPVSGYFWRTVAPMASPLDFVTGLSLTFEQANLDFCRHFARCFTEAGDRGTAALLDRIYRDEIGHVAHGLKWFRQWKDPAEGDWDAYCARLRFPLSPARARGIGFNAEGRRAAGLDPGFIDRLRVHAASKGRTPSVFVFNPFTEERIAHGPGYAPRRPAAALERDLESVPQFLARRDDIVLVTRTPSPGFLAGIQAAGFPLPEFIEIADGRIPTGHPIRDRKLGRLRPWAWGPDSEALLEPLVNQLTTPQDTVQPDGGAPGRTALYSKAWSAEFLREFLGSPALQEADVPAAEWLSPPETVGVLSGSEGDALERIATLRRAGFPRVVLKEPLALAGRRMLLVEEPVVSENQRRWIQRALASGHGVVVEPWLDRVADFAVQFELTPEALRWVGFTGLTNDPRGRFVASRAEPRFRTRPPSDVLGFLPDFGKHHGRIPKLYATLMATLEPRLRALGHTGPLGVDALVYRDADGRHRLKPVVEINPRYTMGRLTLELIRQSAPGIHGVLELISRARVHAAGFPSLAAWARERAQRFPIEMGGHPEPRLRAGLLCLNDPEAATEWLAVFHAGSPDLAARRSLLGRKDATGDHPTAAAICSAG
ncbi:MAG: DUF455 family protein [Verrucomicrobiae bacterium]|nr:DUF455 family protein [Verrucomicrobiae bacterium]